MANDPPKKAWGQVDKDYFQDLINQGKVDITQTTHLKYINQVRHKYFLSCNSVNFQCNFCSYARSRELDDHLSGYTAVIDGEVECYICCFICFMHYISQTPRPLSYFQTI